MNKSVRETTLKNKIDNLISLIEQEHDDIYDLDNIMDIKVLNQNDTIHIANKAQLQEIADAFGLVLRVCEREKDIVYGTEYYLVIRGIKLFALV